MASLKIGMSNDLLQTNKKSNCLEKQVQTKSQMNFHKRLLPRVSNRLLFFEKNKPKITFTTHFRSMNTHNHQIPYDDIVSQSEVILIKRDYEFLHTEPNDMLNPIPLIRKSLKVHKSHRETKTTPKSQPMTLESYIETNPVYAHRLPNQNRIGTTLYSVLTKEKNQFVEQLAQISNKKPILPQMTEEAKKREHCIKLNQSNTNYSDMNKRDAIPIINPIACINDVVYSNISERERYQRLNEELMKVKELIDRKPNFCYSILKEFLLRNGIYEDEYYEIECLNNLNQYLHSSDMMIQANKTLREHIILGLNYKQEEEVKKPNGNGDVINEKNKHHLIKKRIKHKSLIDKRQQSNIRTDMELQKNLYENRLLQTQIDFAETPKQIVDLLKDDFSGEATQCKKTQSKEYHSRLKTQALPANERLYGSKTLRNDFNSVKKNNKILEFICYVKAKKIIQFKEIKRKLMIEDLNKPNAVK